MGFYVRKSLRAGPFRVNLSTSGIGMSAGVPGFRVGTGPRGNYVSVGAGGVRYRTTFGGSARYPAHPHAQSSQPHFAPLPASDIVMQDTTGETAVTLAPTSPDDLVAQLNAAARRPLLWPWVALGALVLVGLSAAVPVLPFVVLVLGIAGTIWLALTERVRRTVVTFYEVTGPTASWFEALVGGWSSLSQMASAWRIAASGAIRTTYQYKVNSGAGALVNRQPARFSVTAPRTLTTNVAVPSVRCGRDSLHFLPDRVLVKNGKHWSDVAYAALRVTGASQRFIESGSVPRDAQQVDTTWQYVNVKGGRDRRFKDNRRLPVMLYGRIQLTSPGGLRWEIDCSQTAASDWARKIFAARA